MDYLQHQGEGHDLSTPEGRRRESIELFVMAQQLPDDEETRWSLTKYSSFVVENRPKMFLWVSPRAALREITARLRGELPKTMADCGPNSSATPVETASVLGFDNQKRDSA